jgi:hypothetical protein
MTTRQHHRSIGGPSWRRVRGLPVLSDLIARYRAPRAPRGPYLTPLPDDLFDQPQGRCE